MTKRHILPHSLAGAKFNVTKGDFNEEFEVCIDNLTWDKLKNGLIVECNNGKKFLFLNRFFINDTIAIDLDAYNSQLQAVEIGTSYNVEKIYVPKFMIGFSNLFNDDNLQLIWRRKNET